MNKELKELKARMDRIEEKLDFKYPRNNKVECKFNIDLALRPMCTPTIQDEIYLNQIENRLKSEIYRDVMRIEDRINTFLKYYF